MLGVLPLAPSLTDLEGLQSGPSPASRVLFCSEEAEPGISNVPPTVALSKLDCAVEETRPLLAEA